MLIFSNHENYRFIQQNSTLTALHHYCSGFPAKVTTMNNPLIKKYSVLTDLTPKEKNTLLQLQRKRELFPAGSEIISAGQKHKSMYILEEGWAAHYKLLADGRQQILNISLPGDFICLDATVIRTAEHSINAITDLVVSRLSPDQILDMFSYSPRLAAILCWSSVHDRAILAEQIVRVGRRNAYESIAHLLLEFLRRLDIIGMTDNNTFYFPLTQELLADTLGLTTVHVNRTIRRLKKDNLIEYSDGKMRIMNLKKLRQVAGFDPIYLDQHALPPGNRAETG